MGAVLVAGGAGFIGSHLVDRLIERGDDVVIVDDLSTGSSANAPDHDRCTLVVGDITDAAVATGLDRWSFDAVLHLASPASPPAYLARPIETLDVGSIGTRHLLELAQRHDARFLLASTSEVYGDPLEHPQTETYHGNVNPVGERSCYDEAKRFAEALTVAYRDARGVDVRIARIFNTYGPRMQPDDGRVVTNFVHQALAGEPLTLYGDGSQTRSFCHVDDLVDGLVALLDSDVTDPVNLGNPAEISVAEFARLVVELTGSASPVEHRPLPSDDPRVRQPDISRARTSLGWEPRIGLRAGLERTIAAFRHDRST
jgi:dTDP-glucose 4,6-dehydratase